jgi:hypothetical protein
VVAFGLLCVCHARHRAGTSKELDPQMLTYTQLRQPVTAVMHECRRCGKPNGQAAINVCVGCRAQEQVARHIAPSAHWFRSR